MARPRSYIIAAHMCGIFGAIGPGVSAEKGARALARLAHRGPDGEGHHFDPDQEVYLGHRRLSIIDLSESGRQPMANEDGSLLLTFNGEIYNHEALRRELVDRGHTFRSRCDAEVILHLYEERGTALLADLHGMFAFGLYDARSRRLWLARDRLGIKPLYYYHDGGVFCFASELKALSAYPGLDLQPDVTAYYDFLTYQFVPAPKTVFRKARKLPAAHQLVFEGGESRVERYWEVELGAQAETTEHEAAASLRALLEEAVREHLVSDVEVGVFLSAGVDSTLVTAMANRIGRAPLRAFTVGFLERADDEAGDAAAIAGLLGSPHSVGTFSMAELLESVAELPGTFDEPFADPAALPMLGLCRHAATEVKVVLSGDGGDETHLGYGRYAKHERRNHLYGIADRIPGLKRLARTGPARSVPWLRSVAEQPLGRPHAFHLGIPRETKRMILDFGGGELDDYDDYWLVRDLLESDLPPLARQQAIDLSILLPDGHLTKVDRTSMSFGLEVRPPLLDHRLVAFAAGLPERLKLRDGVGKPLLRALLRELLPAAPAEARKRAFSVPIKHFVRDEGLFRPTGDLDVFGAFRVNRAKVEQVLTPARDSHKLWLLFTLAAFVGHQEGAATPASIR